jgi:cellulose synthase/poly-beta-1,6-N-acetylglucosamine synthase-like glycosyltransferase
MYQFSLVCFWCLVGITLHNVCWTLFTTSALWLGRKRVKSNDAELPKAAVFLCLRGADPSLPSCLRRLLQQDYPNYELFIAVDSTIDPAWDVVQSTIRELGATNVRVSPLRKRLATCSLKCSSLIQLIDQLDESHQVVALADGDLVSHATWLRELVGPLSDPQVGASYGNHWFVPTQGNFGSLVRQLWNAPGFVVMHGISIPWGGSTAIRTDVMRSGGLRDKWAHCIADDVTVRTVVQAQKLKLKFVPSVVMANREECGFKYACNFIRRQLTWTRTYACNWWGVILVYSLSTILLLALAALMAVVCFFQNDGASSLYFGLGAGTLGLGSLAMWILLDASARRVIRHQGESMPSLFSLHLLRLPVAMVVACWVHVWGAVVATVRRRVVWRGVTYEIRGPWSIRVVQDHGLAVPMSSAVSI